jgi:Tfp pilus assembly pilus retraction ATPase PilT
MLQPILQVLEEDTLISDIHLATDEFIAYRRNGDIVRQEGGERIGAEAIQQVLKELMYHDEKRYNTFYEKRDADFSYVSTNHIPYRVNAYFTTGKLAIAMRKINRTARKLEELMFSDMAQAIKEQILTRKK